MFYIVWTCPSKVTSYIYLYLAFNVSGSEGATFYMLSLSMAPVFGSLCDMSLGPCVEYLALVSSIYLLCSLSQLGPMFSICEQMLLFPLADLLPRRIYFPFYRVVIDFLS